MIKSGETWVVMEFDAGIYTGKFTITHPKLSPYQTTQQGADFIMEKRETLEASIAAIVNLVL